MALTARSLKALVNNLREDELDLPIVVCECWIDPEKVVDSFATVTAIDITLHRVDDVVEEVPA